MGWLTGDRTKKQLAVIDGQQSFMSLDAFGARNGLNAGEVSPDGTYSNYAKNAYGRNEIAYACVRYRAENFPQGVLRVYPQGRGEALDDHRLRKVFEQPNPLCNEFELFEVSSTYLDLAGTCFWLILRGRDGIVSELWPMRPDLVSVLPGRNYLRDPSDYVWVYRPNPERPDMAALIAREDVVRIRYPNPNPDDPGWRWFGQPPLRAGARAVTVDNAATDFVANTLRNHAMPVAVVESEKEITPALHERLRAFWRKAFGGPRRGEPAFLQKGMKVHELGLTMTNLEFPDLRAVAETRVCMAFGVEPILVGAKVGLEHNAYKDYREARLSFWEEAMVTLQRRFTEPIRTQLLIPDFVGVGRRSVRLDWDVTGVPSLKESQQSIWDRAVKGLQAGGLTINDFRALVGLPDLGPDGDVFLMPAGVAPQRINEQPRPVPQPRQTDEQAAAAYALSLIEEPTAPIDQLDAELRGLIDSEPPPRYVDSDLLHDVPRGINNGR